MPLYPAMNIPTPTYTITNPTTQHTFDVAGGTLTDVKNVVGTLIIELKTTIPKVTS